jgi:hypothetical protein
MQSTLDEHASSFKRMMVVIKSLYGEPFGRCVRDMILYDAKSHLVDMSRIDCRIPSMTYVHVLINVLKIDFKVESLKSMQWKINSNVDLYVYTASKRDIAVVGPLFDVDSLMSNNRSITLYPLLTPRDPIDAITQCLSRIHGGTFCLFQHSARGETMQDAMCMVQKGWVMDSKIIDSWSMEVSKVHGDCCICQDVIAKGQVVLKLPCGHMFHGCCKSSKCTIASWFNKSNTCPICRSII